MKWISISLLIIPKFLPTRSASETMSALLKPILLAVLCAQTCTALYVAHGTPCSANCNSTGGSWWTDLVCSTDDFASTTKGRTLQSCLECTIDSTYINSSYTDGNSDQFWTLCRSSCQWNASPLTNHSPHEICSATLPHRHHTSAYCCGKCLHISLFTSHQCTGETMDKQSSIRRSIRLLLRR